MRKTDKRTRTSGTCTFAIQIQNRELCPDPRSVSPSLSCRRLVVHPSSDLPTAQLGISPESLLSQLGRRDVCSLLADVTAAPVLPRTLRPTPVPRAACWSPSNILDNQRSVLAVLSSVGLLDLHVLTCGQFREQANISSEWLRYWKSQWPPPPPSKAASKRLDALRTRADAIFFTSMCWLERSQEGVGMLAAASKNGLISLWQVQASQDKSKLNISLITQIDSGLVSPKALLWMTLGYDNSMLVVAGTCGRVRSALVAQPVSASPSPSLSWQELWEEEDRLAASHLAGWPWPRGGVLLVAVKGPFVVILRTDDSSRLLHHAAYRCTDVSINGLVQLSASEILLATRSCRFTRLSISLDEDKLELSAQSVDTHLNTVHMGCYGLAITQNKVICFVLLSVNQSYDHLRMREPSQVAVCSLSGLFELQSVLQNPERPIGLLWDCLELLRVQMLQGALVAQVSCPRPVLDKMAVDQLTSTLWWATFATATEQDSNSRLAMKSLRCELESLVVSCHFFKRIALRLSDPPSELTSFQIHSLGLMHGWLQRLDRLPEDYMMTLTTGHTLLQQLNTMQPLPTTLETCNICHSLVVESDELFYSNCEQGHRLPRCSLSLTQCSQLPYFACSQCGVLAHSEAGCVTSVRASNASQELRMLKAVSLGYAAFQAASQVETRVENKDNVGIADDFTECSGTSGVLRKLQKLFSNKDNEELIEIVSNYSTLWKLNYPDYRAM